VLPAADPAQGHGRGTEQGQRHCVRRSLLIQTPGWTSPPARSLLTFFLLHPDGGVGDDGGISLQGVVVGAIILLVLERAVLAGLLCRERGHGCKVIRKSLGSSPTCTG